MKLLVDNIVGCSGVKRALLAVGAVELIATQWKVEDHASAELMGEFYQHWFATGFGSQSCRNFINKVTKTLHPAYWAGFVNLG